MNMAEVTQSDRLSSSAPLGWPIRQTSSRNLPHVIPEGVVLQTAKGQRFWRLPPPDRATVIESELAPGTKRANYEQGLYSRSEMQRKDYAGSDLERAHAQGAGTGFEAKYGISYAPREVNQELQNLGIEEFLRLLETYRPKDVVFQLLTVVRRHPGSLRLSEIIYRLDAIYQSQRRFVFSTGIRVPTGSDPRPAIADDLTEVNPEAFKILPINDLPTSILLRRVEMMVRARGPSR
jgi:hypothetical protein